MSEQKEDVFHLFFSNPGSMQVIDSTGKPMMFVAGRFHTKDPGQIAMLNQMVENGSGSIFRDPNQLTASADELNPEAVYKRKIIDEYLQEQARNQFLDPNNAPGESVQGPLNAGSTTDIAPVTIGGQSVIPAPAAPPASIQAALDALKAKS